MSNHTAVQRSVEEGTVRARVAFVLVIAERVIPLVQQDLRDRADAGLALSWKWVAGKPFDAEDLYERFTRVTEWEFKAASRLEKDAVLALESAIYYACWQAFRAEKASGKPIEKGVPNDMAEGSERVATQVADFIEKTDRFEDYCASSPSMLGRAMADFPKKLAGKVERKVPSRSMRLGFVRDEANGRGMVACFVSDKPAGLDSLKERLERYFSTWQLD